MKIKPLADRVVVKPVEVEETTSSGIILALWSAPYATANEYSSVIRQRV